MIHFELALNGLFGMSVPSARLADLPPRLRLLGLYGALQKGDIQLVGAPTKLTAKGATFADGKAVELDAIVYATGCVVAILRAILRGVLRIVLR